MTTSNFHQVPRAAAVVALGGVALIHLLELQTKLKEVPYLGVGYILLVAASVIAAALLIHSNSRIGWIIGGGAALATLIGFALNRTVGLPQSKDDIGNWLEPMALAAMFIEAVVVMLAAYAFSMMSRPSHNDSAFDSDFASTFNSGPAKQPEHSHA